MSASTPKSGGSFKELAVEPLILTGAVAIIAALLARPPNEKVRSFQTSSISFHCNTPVAWTLDGEYGGNHEDSYVEILPQAVQMIRGRDTV